LEEPGNAERGKKLTNDIIHKIFSRNKDDKEEKL